MIRSVGYRAASLQQQWAEACTQCTVHQECLQRRRELGDAIVNTSGELINHDLIKLIKNTMFMCWKKTLRDL